MVKIVTLENGLRLVLEEIPYVRSISFGIWVNNGSRHESDELSGISHFIEHMIFKGTQIRSAKDIAEEMDEVGGQINAYTTKEYTCYHTRVLDKHFEKAVDVLSDMFLNSRFDNTDIKREFNVICEEINMYKDTPEDLVHEQLQTGIYQNASVGRPILGYEDKISKFDHDILRNYFDENYYPQNTVISVAGNFKSEEAVEILKKYFGAWKSNKNAEERKFDVKYKPSFEITKKDIEQLHFCLAFPGLGRDHEKKYVLLVLNTIFGGGMSSRLFQRVREENGLTYSIYSYSSAYQDTGIFAVYAGLNPAQTETVLSLIFEVIKEIKNKLIDDKTINKTKEQILSNYLINSESTMNRMSSNGGSMLIRGRIQTAEEIINDISKVTAEDVLALANEIFNFEMLSFSAVGKTDGIKFKEIIDRLKKNI